MNSALFRRGLRALAHPIAVGAAVVLGVNALVAQRWWPSWWTGKLGDAAWLIVAPLLIATVVGLLLPRRVHPGVAGVAMITLIGLAYALVKAWAPANVWAVGLFRGIGFEPKLALDPTDLIALPAVLIGLWLWRQAGEAAAAPSTWRLPRALAATLAALALLADSPAPQQLGVVCVEARDGGFYAYSQVEQSTYFEGEQRNWSEIYASDDGGATWVASTPTDEDRAREVSCGQTTWPIVVDEATRLFFVSGQGIYASADEGQTLTLEQSLANAFSVLVDDSTGAVIVAAGVEGLFVRSPDGVWSQTGTP